MTERQELGSLEAMLFAHAEPVDSQNTDEIKDCHTENRMKKRREIRIGSLQHGHDIAVDQGLHEHGSLYVCQHADKN